MIMLHTEQKKSFKKKFQKLLLQKSRDFGESYHHLPVLILDFLFLTMVLVYIFLESVSVKAVMTHIFQPGVRNLSISVSWCEIKIFNLRAIETCAYFKVWKLAGIIVHH